MQWMAAASPSRESYSIAFQKQAAQLLEVVPSSNTTYSYLDDKEDRCMPYVTLHSFARLCSHHYATAQRLVRAGSADERSCNSLQRGRHLPTTLSPLISRPWLEHRILKAAEGSTAKSITIGQMHAFLRREIVSHEVGGTPAWRGIRFPILGSILDSEALRGEWVGC